MKRSIYIIMCMALLVGASCSSEKKDGERKAVTAKVQSAPYELLVVVDKDWLQTEAGQALVDVVEKPIEGLPQVEPNFRVTYINPHAFSGTFRTYANILVVKLGKKYEEARLAMQENVYARPQVVLYLEAPDDRALVEYVERNGTLILDKLNLNEFERERAYLKKHHNGGVATQAKRLFGIDICVPEDIDEVKKGKDFLWASASKQEFRLNVCLYTLPSQTMTVERVAEVRDSVMKVNIPGGREDQWMETDLRTVTGRMMQWDGKQTLSVRGLWDMKNDAMGGPFVCYVYADSTNERLLVAEGFVFAPEEKKRPLIRQLEAALQTIVLP